MYEFKRKKAKRAKSAIDVRITAKKSEKCDTCTNYNEKQRKVRYMHELQRKRAKRAKSAIHVRITAKNSEMCETCTNYRDKERKCDTCTNYSEKERKVRYMYKLQRKRAKRAKS